MKSKARIRAGKIVSVAVSALVLALLILVVYLFVCGSTGKPAFVFRYAVLHIITGSMEPDIPVGSYIIIEKTDTDDLKPGDVITFYSRQQEIAGRMNTHRIEKVNDDNSFVTRGINNPADDDDAVLPEEVVGKYVCIATILTFISGALGKQPVFMLLVMLPAMSLLLYFAYDLVKKAKKAKFDMAVEAEVERIKLEEAEKQKISSEENAENVKEIEAEKRDKEIPEEHTGS